MPTFAACEFPLLDDSQTIERVRGAVRAAEPFSLIRLGDGEAIVLSFGDDTWLQDLSYLQGHWGMEGVTVGAIAQVSRDLHAAIRGADVIGIRDDIVNVAVPEDLLDRTGVEIRDFVTSRFRIRQDERANLSSNGARRLALSHRVLSQTEFSEGQQFCSAWIHWELLATGTLHSILEDVSDVVLVTARPELEHLVAHRFDVRTTAVIVPDKFVEAPGIERHVPDRYRSIRSELTFPHGTVVLVGAGIPGKVYCQWLKEAGCVAIDVGAVFDAWVGKASRPLILKSRFNIERGDRVPWDLQLGASVPRAGRRLSPRWKSSGVPS